MADPKHQAKYYTYSHIRAHGAIGNLNEGGYPDARGSHEADRVARNGFQTESVHVLMLKPGERVPPMPIPLRRKL